YGAEPDEEGERGRLGRDTELRLRDERQHRALEAHHGTHERVDDDEEGELAPVRPQAKADQVIRRALRASDGRGGQGLRLPSWSARPEQREAAQPLLQGVQVRV